MLLYIISILLYWTCLPQFIHCFTWKIIVSGNLYFTKLAYLYSSLSSCQQAPHSMGQERLVGSLSGRERGYTDLLLSNCSWCCCLLLLNNRMIYTQVFTWNTDAWGYGTGTTSLYQSHPWVLAVLPNGESLGILADTTRRCEVLMTVCLLPISISWKPLANLNCY